MNVFEEIHSDFKEVIRIHAQDSNSTYDESHEKLTPFLLKIISCVWEDSKNMQLEYIEKMEYDIKQMKEISSKLEKRV